MLRRQNKMDVPPRGPPNSSKVPDFEPWSPPQANPVIFQASQPGPELPGVCEDPDQR